MYIYKVTNLINNKVYIGQTVRSIKERWQEHCRPSRKHALSFALKKYGKENFTIEVLEECDSIEELNKREIEYISQYDSMSKTKGYNQCLGGNNTTGFKYTIESRLKMSESKKGKYCKEKNHFFGKKHTDETRAKMRKAWETREPDMKGIKKAQEVTKRKVRNIDTGEVFDSVKEASQAYNVANTNISKACRRGGKCRGCNWEYVNKEYWK